jgi:Transcriptional regulators
LPIGKNNHLFAFMSGLDATDLAILRILQEDAALTNKQVAARVHLSPTPVFERIRRLREQGYIKGYVAVLDAEKLDCSFIAFCYIKMKQHTFENASRLMEAVQGMEEVGECYNISGDYDFLLKVYVSSMKEYQQFVLRILGELDCIGGLNSSFVMGEVKNTHAVPVR